MARAWTFVRLASHRLAALCVLSSAATLAAQQRGAPAPGQAPAQRPAPPPPADPFRFQMMGPAEGGRISAITGVPGDARVWYLGAASGGVWKSVDSGATFRPVSDSMPVQAIGALAIAPSKPSIVWAGTGEAWAIRDADLHGRRRLQVESTRATTWQHMGLERDGTHRPHHRAPDESEHRLRLRARSRDRASRQSTASIARIDGGKTWKLVLTLGGNYGCSGLTLDEKNPKVLFAGMWHVIMHTYAMYSGTHDPKDGVYVTRDGGDTWKQVLDPGLPQAADRQDRRRDRADELEARLRAHSDRRPGLRVALRRRRRVVEGRQLSASAHWTRRLLHQPQSVAGEPRRDPHRQQQLLSLEGRRQDVRRSAVGRRQPRHLDRSEEPESLRPDQRRRRAPHDRSRQDLSDRSRCRSRQMYHVAVDNQIPYWVYGNRQDNGTMRGPSTAPEGATATRGIAAGAGRGGRGGERGANADTTNGRGRARGAGRAALTARGGTRRGERRAVPGGRGGRGAGLDSTGADSTGGGRGGRRRWLRRILDVGSRPRRLRVRLHAARSHRSEHRVGELLRERSHALRSSRQARAIGEPVDSHARLAAEQAQVPLPLDAAAGDRSVRSRTPCTTAARSYSRPLIAARAGASSAPICRRTIRRASYRRAASSRTTSASSTAKSCSRSRRRRFSAVSSGPARTTASSGTRRTRAAATLDRCHEGLTRRACRRGARFARSSRRTSIRPRRTSRSTST